ncbi:MAG: hypothetical protein KTR35_20160 [Gammaproteobacteria bacterium]|nr:hypothetical protein [Gammaproteobacteria bacterium]
MSLLIPLAPPLWASDEAFWVLRLGYDDGGDRLIRGIDADGDSDTLEAGTAGYVEAGIMARLGVNPSQDSPITLPIDLEINLGFKSDQIEDDQISGGDVSFERWTITGIAWWRIGKLRTGFGPVIHFDPVIHFEGSGANLGTDSTFGATALVDYTVLGAVQMGARATMMDYSSDTGKSSADAVGVYMGFQF